AFLLVGAVHDQRRSDQTQGQAVDRARHIRGGHLFGDDRLFHGPRILATVLARPAHTDEAGLIQLPLPGLLLLERIERPWRMLGEPAAHALAKALVLG